MDTGFLIRGLIAVGSAYAFFTYDNYRSTRNRLTDRELSEDRSKVLEEIAREEAWDRERGSFDIGHKMAFEMYKSGKYKRLVEKKALKKSMVNQHI